MISGLPPGEGAPTVPSAGADLRLRPDSYKKFARIAVSILRAHQHRNRPRTYQTTRSTVKHLIKTFPGKSAHELVPDDFYRVHLPRCRRERPERNLNNDLKIWIQIMWIAFKRGLIQIPPVGILKPDKEKRPVREILPWEIKKLFAECKDLKLSDQMLFAYDTGTRLREMLGLKWEYINFETHCIYLPPEVVKTGRGRWVPMTARVTDMLVRRRIGSKSKYVFPQKCGSKPQYDNKYHWDKLTMKCGIEVTWHDWRHTCATNLARSHVKPNIACQFLGMSLEMFLRRYSHLMGEDFRACAISSAIA